jgi:membrane fusion protein, multidrug efflux system
MLKWILPFAVLIILIAASFALMATKPEAKRFAGRPQAAMLVETEMLTPQDYTVKVTSQGIVQAKTQTLLTPQVSGKVMSISDKLDVGAQFKQGDILIQLDDADYQIDLQIAQADVANAESALQQELAQAEVARKEWELRKRRNTQGKSLFLREPQVKAAKASLAASNARFKRAKLNLERTNIKAPYDGIVKSKQVSLGQNVNANSQLATLFSVDVVELRLPIKNRELDYLIQDQLNQPVDIYLTDKPTVKWTGYVHHMEAAIDEATRQLHAIVRVNNPYNDPTKPLRVGTFVEAQITARSYSNVFVIPRYLLNQKNEVAIKEQNKMIKREVVVAWKGSSEAILSAGVSANEQIITTPVSNLASGTAVNTSEEVKAQKAQMKVKRAKTSQANDNESRKQKRQKPPKSEQGA